MTKEQKIILYLLACVQFTNIMDFMIMMPMGPILMRTFNITAREYSFLVSAYSLSAGISGLLLPFLWINLTVKMCLRLPTLVC